MIKKLPKENMGTANIGWLESRYHFSFENYRNPANVKFGVLRVLNDELMHPMSGVSTHPHANMEIVSYIIDGEITHEDSMGNSETLKRGEVQYISAGDGIYHSEYNHHKADDLRLLQIWIFPPEKGLPRLYGSHKYKKEQRDNKLLKIVSSQNSDCPIKLYQDVNIYVSELDKPQEFTIGKDRQVYFVQIEGKAKINGVILENGDAMELVDENKFTIQPILKSHILFIEMKKQATFNYI